MKTALLPCNTRVLFRQDDPEQKSKGGVIIPDQAQQKPGKGKVLAVGPEVKEIQEADLIFFNKYDVTYLEIEGAELAVIDEENVLLRLGRVE